MTRTALGSMPSCCNSAATAAALARVSSSSIARWSPSPASSLSTSDASLAGQHLPMPIHPSIIYLVCVVRSRSRSSAAYGSVSERPMARKLRWPSVSASAASMPSSDVPLIKPMAYMASERKTTNE